MPNGVTLRATESRLLRGPWNLRLFPYPTPPTFPLTREILTDATADSGLLFPPTVLRSTHTVARISLWTQGTAQTSSQSQVGTHLGIPLCCRRGVSQEAAASQQLPPALHITNQNVFKILTRLPTAFTLALSWCSSSEC